MSKTKAGASRPRGPAARPLSPHLQVWRWHVTMLVSILHRMSGFALYAGAAAVVGWLFALSYGGECYALFLKWAASPLGLVVWFAFSAAAIYHLFSGVRHLIWDLGVGLKIPSANALSLLSIVLSAAATIAFWAWLFVSGKVVL